MDSKLYISETLLSQTQYKNNLTIICLHYFCVSNFLSMLRFHVQQNILLYCKKKYNYLITSMIIYHIILDFHRMRSFFLISRETIKSTQPNILNTEALLFRAVERAEINWQPQRCKRRQPFLLDQQQGRDALLETPVDQS